MACMVYVKPLFFEFKKYDMKTKLRRSKAVTYAMCRVALY